MVRAKSAVLMLLAAAVLPAACGGEAEDAADECGLECTPRGGAGSGGALRGGSGGLAGDGSVAGERSSGGAAGAAGSDGTCPEDFYAAENSPCPSEGKVCRQYECNSEVASLTCENGLGGAGQGTIWKLAEIADAGCEPDEECPLDLFAAVGGSCVEEGKYCVDWDVCEFGLFIQCVEETWRLPSDYLYNVDDDCLWECPSNLQGDGSFEATGRPCPTEGKFCGCEDYESSKLVCEAGVWVYWEPEVCPAGAGGAGGMGGGPG